MTGKADGKRALIYGGGTGLGLACAEALLDAGASVFMTGRRHGQAGSCTRNDGALGPHRRRGW